METRVPERGGVSDVVEPCCDHQETRFPVSYGAGESSGPPGNGGMPDAPAPAVNAG